MTLAKKRGQTVSQGFQDAGKMLLAIEGRIGELLPEPDQALKTTLPGAGKAKRPEGINPSFPLTSPAPLNTPKKPM